MPSIRRTGKRKELARRLRNRREELGFRQEDVAKHLRIDRIQWANVESGQQSVPTERLVEVCGILQLTPNDLLGWSDAQIESQEPVQSLVQSQVHIVEANDNSAVAEAA